jgi:hypothetical protein
MVDGRLNFLEDVARRIRSPEVLRAYLEDITGS